MEALSPQNEVKTMNIQFKGIKIGKLIITTRTQLEKSEFIFDSKDIWDLLKMAMDEDKIVFISNSTNTKTN